MNDAFVLRSLESRDANNVRKWLADWLEHHIAGWSRAYGLAWTADEIRMHISDENLVGREWRELSEAAGDSERFIRVAEINGNPAGIVYAEQRVDRYLTLSHGVLSWLYVVPEARGLQLAASLLESAHDWMRAQRLAVSELFATASNQPALRTYDRAGYRVVDHRLVAALALEKLGK
jgi:GNAT superfamily N-acetyltransferase